MNQVFSKIDTAKQFAVRIAQLLQELRAENPVIIDLNDCAHIYDFFVICTARSKMHQIGLSDAVNAFVAKQKTFFAYQPKKRTKESDAWLVLDYTTIIVHIMSEQARSFYELERLWFDAPRVTFLDSVDKALSSE